MNEKKVVVITGGTSGLGLETVKLFLGSGWKVATCGRRKARIDKLNSEGNPNLLADICDISIDSSSALFLKEVEQSFGRIDILILNAATLGPIPLREVSDLNIMDLRMTFEINFFGNFQFMRMALPLLRDGGKIVHITSDAATTPYPGWGAYSSSKIAFDLLLKILDKEIASRRITAFSFDPGDMDTPMHRAALPDDKLNLKDPRIAARELFEKVTDKEGRK
jgi:NAD(P)-dependent dehydrogenase (short-subunit alcohol dehydrogenase family)